MENLAIFPQIRTPHDTVKVMVGLARTGAHTALVRRTAEDLLRGIAENRPELEVQALFNYVRLNVRYTQDIHDLETLKTPESLITEIEVKGTGTGDCDDMSLLLASLLVTSGYKTRFVLAYSFWNDSDEANHVFVQYFNPLRQEWVSLEPIIKEAYVGYEGQFRKLEGYDI